MQPHYFAFSTVSREKSKKILYKGTVSGFCNNGPINLIKKYYISHVCRALTLTFFFFIEGILYVCGFLHYIDVNLFS